MIHFFGQARELIYAVQSSRSLSDQDQSKLSWLFGNQPLVPHPHLEGFFVGPRAAMITPWSTNAVEITQNMGVSGI